MSLSELPVRPELLGLTPYGAPDDAVPVALNVNENTHGLPQPMVERLAEALAAEVSSVNRYPDREFPKLRSALAGYLGHALTAEHIWAANGSNEVIQQFLQAFAGPGRTLMSFTPTYTMYGLLAATTGTNWQTASRSSGRELSAEQVRAALLLNQPDVVVLCSPNNPTGTPLPLQVVEAAYDAAPGMVIVDEAYKEFDRTPSALSLLAGRPRLVVTRTLSKAFAFAGVRLGYLAADPAVIDALRLVRLPYHLSTLTQLAAELAIAHAPEVLASVQQIIAQREFIAAQLEALGLQVAPSETNFLLVSGVGDSIRAFESLRADGILVRDVGIDGSLRITVGTASENAQVVASLSRFLFPPATERSSRGSASGTTLPNWSPSNIVLRAMKRSPASYTGFTDVDS